MLYPGFVIARKIRQVKNLRIPVAKIHTVNCAYVVECFVVSNIGANDFILPLQLINQWKTRITQYPVEKLSWELLAVQYPVAMVPTLLRDERRNVLLLCPLLGLLSYRATVSRHRAQRIEKQLPSPVTSSQGTAVSTTRCFDPNQLVPSQVFNCTI